MIVKVKKTKGAALPKCQTKNSAGDDISAFLSEPLVIKAHERVLVPTGLFLEIPEGYEIQLRPRSGLALNKGITLLNTPGTIDSDYRGELKVLLINTSNEDVLINNGDRIAQAILSPVIKAEWKECEELNKTERSENGWGSTGVK